jgi:hypothetical protein
VKGTTPPDSTRTGFKGNEIAIEAGLQAKTYGKTPSEIMFADELTRAERFWLNAQVRAATAQFVNEKREEQQDAATSAGAADPQQQRELHDRQDDRAQTRESMEQAGMQAPSAKGQLQQLQEKKSQEADAESLLGDDPDLSGPSDGDNRGDQ